MVGFFLLGLAWITVVQREREHGATISRYSIDKRESSGTAVFETAYK